MAMHTANMVAPPPKALSMETAAQRQRTSSNSRSMRHTDSSHRSMLSHPHRCQHGLSFGALTFGAELQQACSCAELIQTVAQTCVLMPRTFCVQVEPFYQHQPFAVSAPAARGFRGAPGDASAAASRFAPGYVYHAVTCWTISSHLLQLVSDTRLTYKPLCLGLFARAHSFTFVRWWALLLPAGAT